MSWAETIFLKKSLIDTLTNQRMFIPSDQVLLTFSGKTLGNPGGDNAYNNKLIGTFTPQYDGNIDIWALNCYDTNNVNSSVGRGFIIIEQENSDGENLRIAKKEFGGTSSDPKEYKIANIQVERGKKYLISMQVYQEAMGNPKYPADSHKYTIGSVTLNADVVDRFLFDYTQE